MVTPLYELKILEWDERLPKKQTYIGKIII